MTSEAASECPMPESLPQFYSSPLPSEPSLREPTKGEFPIVVVDSIGLTIAEGFVSSHEATGIKTDEVSIRHERGRLIDIGYIAALAAEGDNPLSDAIKIATHLEAIKPSSGQRMANMLRTLWPLAESNKHLYNARREEYGKGMRLQGREERLGISLLSWWGDLSEVEKRTVRLETETDGAQLFTSFTIKTSERSYRVGKIIELPQEVIEYLNDSDQALVKRRKEYWQALNINNASELQELTETCFERVAFDPDDIEMKWLNAADPWAYARLVTLTAAGNEVFVWRMVQTPDAILDNVRIISEHYYGSHTSWLPHALRTDVEPRVVPSDIEQLEQEHLRAQTRIRKKTDEGNLERALLMRIIDENFKRAMGHEEAIATIFRALHITRSIEVTGALNEEDRYAVERANAALVQGLGREFAARKIIEDDSARTSEGGIAFLKGSVIFSILDEFIGRGVSNAAAEGIGGFSDDVMTAFGDRKMLEDAGIAIKELRVFTGVLGATTAAMAALATQIDKIGILWGDAAKGYAYEVEATGIGMAMTILVMTLFTKKSKKLGEEDKLPHHVKLPSELEKWLQETDMSADDVIDILSASLEAAGMDKKRLEMHLNELRQIGSIEGIIRYCLPPNASERLKIGFTETITVNPARGGIVKGQAMAWIIGATMGWLFMKDPAAYTILGGIEVPIGLGLMTYDRKIKNARSFRKWVEEDTLRLQRIRESTPYTLTA